MHDCDVVGALKLMPKWTELIFGVMITTGDRCCTVCVVGNFGFTSGIGDLPEAGKFAECLHLCRHCDSNASSV